MNSDTGKDNKETLNQRYFFKVSSNIVSIFAGIFTAAIVPRALGVSAYGDFSFVNNVITQILSFLDMRASTCFYVKLSQRQTESKIITFYGVYTILVFIILLFIIGTLIFAFSPPFLFEGISKVIVGLSLAFVVVKWIADIFIKISDAYGTTVSVERIKIINQILSVGVLAALFYLNVVNLPVFYIHQILVFIVLVILIFLFFKRNNFQVPFAIFIDKVDFKRYAKEFFLYSSPLVIYLAITLLTEIFDRYTLQRFGGSYQQGLYGFSFSISTMTILFVTSMVPLFTRELSIAFATGDIKLASNLYRKYVPIIYLISAYFCCFLFVNAENVIVIFGGDQFRESILSLRILLIYPLLSTYSNLNGSVVYAKSGNSLFRNISLILLPGSIIATFFLISDQFMNLGAVGLAIKVTILEFISIVIVMVYLSKHLKITLYKYFIHMILSPLILIFLAFAIKEILLYVFNSGETISTFLFSGLIYTFLLGALFYFWPILMGLSREDFQSLKQKIRKVLQLEPLH